MVSLPYAQHGVSIDKTLARAGGETIQISTITSIHFTSSYGMWWMPGVAAGLGAFGAMLGGGGILLFAALAAAAALCFWMAGRSRTYNVVVTIASGNQKKFAETRDPAAAQEIRSALEMAISEHG
ncbi:DUF6232 family protein [uncultured Paracoccus sp.]|uniref:DUF6232 family protein n=1 Tax=uncultured Paracoccus sp. TaxID=189685 RepID=UPI0025DEA30D|nr:DUF6232 family protein [uncultured Paracoccus sp.]